MRELCEVVELKAVALLVLGTRVHEVTHQQDNLRSRVSVNTNENGNGNGITNTESYVHMYST